jgi:hypothetical protein
MRTRVNARHTQLPVPQAGEDRIEPVSFVFDDEEDAFCEPYFVAGREGDIPALQEYLHELRAD